MEVRGERECKDCGTRWSYYETGEVTCPACGSVRSVGVEDERRRQTDLAPTLDLDAARTAAANRPLREAADEAADAARAYVRERGFVAGGELLPLDDTYLAAQELRYVAGELGRALDVEEDAEYYFLTLLRGADEGDRPDPAEVPPSFRSARGLAVAKAVSEYRTGVRRWLDAQDDEGGEASPEVADVLETLGDHVRRVEALDGAVDPKEAESLVRAARDVGDYLGGGGEAALVSAEERLKGLA